MLLISNFFFSPAAKLPEDKMSSTFATISFCTGETHQARYKDRKDTTRVF